MTVVTFPLGTLPDAVERGGDCRARDLARGRNVHGPHSFATPSDCQISNGLITVTVGAAGLVPTLGISSYRGEVTIGDYYSDIYSDVYSGDTSVADWHSMGHVEVDSPDTSALLTAVYLERLNAEALTIRLVASAIADAYVTLQRGWRSVKIQHGRTRSPINLDRKVRWLDDVNPVGTGYPGRVQEDMPAVSGFPRVLACRSTVDVYDSLFSLVANSVDSATFLAGIGTSAVKDRPVDLHAQLSDASWAELAVREDEEED